MFTRKGVRRALATLTLAAVASLSAAPIANADPTTNDTVTATEIAAALTKADAQNSATIAAPVASTADADSAAQTLTIDVPKDADAGVSMKSTDGLPTLTVDLPNADNAANATRLPDGTVVYPSNDGSANAVIAAEGDSAQMITTIANNGAPTHYEYGLKVAGGSNVVLMESGGALVNDTNGNTLRAVPAPWARDAKGATVPSHYATNNGALTLVVDHTSGNYAYPIVADPIWIPAYLVWRIIKCGGSGALAWITAGGFNWWQRLLISVGACVFSL
ncbi:MAG TPA: hypothetical protein VFO38_06080 [Candidatus Saccharimonadales bacterium]|nr:hypothetical protein [Candidatus Saccharimonadales bacterium]